MLYSDDQCWQIMQQRDGDFVDFMIPKIGFVNKKV
jgi:hypothetical protein